VVVSRIVTVVVVVVVVVEGSEINSETKMSFS
jgi:hypothetical protein